MKSDTLSNFILRKYLRLEDEFLVKLGTNTASGALFAKVRVLPLWRELSLYDRIKAIMIRKWVPPNDMLENAAREILLREVFGKEEDFAYTLYNLNLLHQSREWRLDMLTESDNVKVEGLRSSKILLAVKNWTRTSNYLHLSLGTLSVQMCLNLIPASFYIPVMSLRYCLEIQENYTFNSIRKAKHPLADDLIAYLYDILFIQQKIANSFYNLVVLMDKVRNEKTNALMTSNEVDALTIYDTCINYLKATVEKGILLVALTHEIKNLDGYKRHQQKLSALEKNLPQAVKETPYFQFFWKYVQSDSLSELNNLRSGINHKKGVSRLQPHSFVGKKFEETSLWEQFSILKHTHQMNTLMLVGAISMLADNLILRKPPTSEDNWYMEQLFKIGEPVLEQMERDLTIEAN